MSFAKLPEELLREILAYALYVPHDEFCRPPALDPAVASEKPASKKKRKASRAGLLLVSKRWLRVGTPLLYECLRLSRRKHARLVTKVLQENPRLGNAVRCLRLEGAYSKKLADVVKLTPRVRTLYIDVDVDASQRINGLLKALPLLNPENLFLRDCSRTPDTRKREICAAIADAISDRTWSLLKTYTNLHCAPMTSRLASALRRAPSLRELVIQASEANQWLAAGYMQKIVKNRGLRQISCQVVSSSDQTHRKILPCRLDEKQLSDRAKQLFVFEPHNAPIEANPGSRALRECNTQ
ncbi:hypothetical protein PsYK624_139220 [Phanerochaete sordida]|uniref:Uncharacterized protein n=1 Tax=Phanerochaete sordida TaxID=48140 RepID=A0A9P3GMF5_9APHY|nr:hypothetical protein PsYK624_139220 [Phanerochaete sordida]